MNSLVQKLSQEIERLEGVKSRRSATKITYAHRLPFATIFIKNKLVELEFTTPSKINHARLKKVKQIKADKFSHKISLAKEEDIDPQVTGWIMIAHATN
ncbi:MAG: hypothetical protein HYS86_00900 [Candidatus Chisholmbacteria bacterium]|nr:hypothetical protein [Candidatus Chisholmbacteria bacterium]